MASSNSWRSILCISSLLSCGCGGGVTGVDGGDAGDSAVAGDAGGDSDIQDAGADTASGGLDGGFSVKSVPGLVLWLDGAAGIVQNAMRVSSWADQSGNGNHAGQPTGSMQPVYAATAIGKRACVHFDGASNDGQMLLVPDAPSLRFGTGDFLVVVVARYDNPVMPDWAHDSAAFFQKAAFMNPNDGVWFFGNTPSWAIMAFDSVTSRMWGATYFAWHVTSQSDGYNDAAGRVFGFRRTGGVLELRAGGSPAGMANQGGTVDVSAPGAPVRIGATGGSGSGWPEAGVARLNGDICEIIAVKGSISAGDLSGIEGYLKGKYGL
jgi:hypothetical protein